jgi:hypothetical protein
LIVRIYDENQKKFVKKLSKSCLIVDKKLAKSRQKVVKKLVKILKQVRRRRRRRGRRRRFVAPRPGTTLSHLVKSKKQ